MKQGIMSMVPCLVSSLLQNVPRRHEHTFCLVSNSLKIESRSPMDCTSSTLRTIDITGGPSRAC